MSVYNHLRIHLELSLKMQYYNLTCYLIQTVVLNENSKLRGLQLLRGMQTLRTFGIAMQRCLMDHWKASLNSLFRLPLKLIHAYPLFFYTTCIFVNSR